MQAFRTKVRPLAFHLPQFHTIPENDAWWGNGFTEWSNVKRARPRFKGHNQPHVPFNDNFYDLSNLEHLHWQKELAKKFGIHGFCFYHYWFNGKLLLEKPIEMVHSDTNWDFPFCLCWANENWTRTWDGKDNEILVKQEYSLEDDAAHFDYFLKFFKNRNYLRVDGKPVLIIYRSELLPDSIKTTDLWKEMAIKNGFKGIYLIRVESFARDIEPKQHGFDSSIDFQPDWSQLSDRLMEPITSKILRRLKGKQGSQYGKNKIYSYKNYVGDQIINKKSKGSYKRYPCVMPSWDNSPRREENALIFTGASPSMYKSWLRSTVDEFLPFSKNENFIFINAWNEWGEGNHLEPCKKWGYGYLEATKEIFQSNDFED